VYADGKAAESEEMPDVLWRCTLSFWLSMHCWSKNFEGCFHRGGDRRPDKFRCRCNAKRNHAHVRQHCTRTAANILASLIQSAADKILREWARHLIREYMTIMAVQRRKHAQLRPKLTNDHLRTSDNKRGG